jgi:2-epi-5-epi-valiolone 7-phosphate 2-epimerase
MAMKNKIGICQWCIPLDGPFACKVISALGFDGIILDGGYSLSGFHISQKIVQDAYRECGKKYSVVFPNITVRELDFSSIFAPKNSKESAWAFNAIKISINAANAMGIPLVLIPNFERSLIRSKNDLNSMVKVFKDTCDYALDKKITIASENVLSIDENLELIKNIKRSNFKLYLDTQNPYLHKGYKVEEMIERLFPYIIEVHVKDGKGRDLSGALLGHGDSGFYKSINALKKLGYSGWINLENYYDKEPLRLQNENYFELIKQDIGILKAALE